MSEAKSLLSVAKNILKFILSMDGLVPEGLYTAWLVRKLGSLRGNKADLDLGKGYLGLKDSDERKHTNAIFANRKGIGYFYINLNNQFADTSGQAFVNLDQWDEVHIAFHADNLGHGAVPGANHWTQIIFPIR
jgi:hypothetical protein